VRHADGTWRWIELFGSDHTATAGVGGLIVNARDITARHDANDDLARSAALLSSVMRASVSEAIFVTDADARIIAFSRGAECLLGYTADEVVGVIHPRAFHPADELSALATELGVESADGLFVYVPPHDQSLLRELTFIRKDGTSFDGSLVISTRHEPDGSLAGFLYIAADVTERLQREAKLTRAADHDSLTGLANRNFLHRALGIAVHEDSWHSPGRVVLFLDLDRFKNVNDTLGHAAGDAVLVAVAQRLTHLLRADDIAVRLGGDEFVVLLAPGITTPQAIKIAERIVAAIGREFNVGDERIAIGASVGLSRSRDSWTPEQLLHAADTAAYRAKQSGRGKVISTIP
jgi:diguanylate cyclase (GGDEF)-like protein/PAS domain S-box-containing protein